MSYTVAWFNQKYGIGDEKIDWDPNTVKTIQQSGVELQAYLNKKDQEGSKLVSTFSPEGKDYKIIHQTEIVTHPLYFVFYHEKKSKHHFKLNYVPATGLPNHYFLIANPEYKNFLVKKSKTRDKFKCVGKFTPDTTSFVLDNLLPLTSSEQSEMMRLNVGYSFSIPTTKSHTTPSNTHQETEPCSTHDSN